MSPAPILPTIPDKCTQGDAASPRDEATAHCDLEISGHEHSLSLGEPLGHEGSTLVPNTALAFTRACRAGLVGLAW